MSLDEQLLAQQQEPDERNAETAWGAYDSARESAWSEKASRLREAQRAGGPDGQGATSLREAVLAEKKKAGATPGSDGESGSSPSPLKQGASKLLQQSWLNLITSFGCTLIWINIHAFFLNQIFGEKFFCNLGDEWKDMIPGGGAAAAGAIGGVAGKVAGAAADAKPPVKPSMEIWGLIGCDLGCLFLLIAVASVIYIISAIIFDPVSSVKIIGEALWDLLKSIFQ
ncbi:MAG: hypothetical protein WC719_03865 [Patescibacteria group bacterium]|jgi:hypothetical protein